MLSATRMIAESHQLCRALNLCVVPDGPFSLVDSVSHLSAGQQWSHRIVVKIPDLIKVETEQTIPAPGKGPVRSSFPM